MNFFRHIGRKIWPFLLVTVLLFSQRGAAGAQTETPWLAEAAALLESMSVEERVGQLFMVTFIGDQALPDSDITDLIASQTGKIAT